MDEQKPPPPKSAVAAKSNSIENMADMMLELLDGNKKPKTEKENEPKTKTGSHPKTKKKGKADAAAGESCNPSSSSKPPVFPGTQRQKPIYWGPCTIYTSDTKWRVKLAPGDRKDVCRPFTDNPKKGWAAVISLCREKGSW